MMAKAVTQTTKSGLLDALAARRRGEPQPPSWLASRQDTAATAFERNGVPTTKSEAWRQTNIKGLDALQYAPPTTTRRNIPAAVLDGFRLGTVDCHELVFVDGRFDAALSRLDALPEGVSVRPLVEAANEATRTPALEAHLAAHAATGGVDVAMVALNTALFQDGVFIHLQKGTVVDLPIHVLWVMTPTKGAADALVAPRTLVVAEPLAEATIIESFCGTDDARGLVTAVTELVAGDGSTIEHVTLQVQTCDTTHVHHVHGTAARNARLATFVHSEGAALARNDAFVRLDAEGAECGLFGLFLGAGEQHVDNHTTIDHAKPHTDSVENYRGILTGAAHGVFTGSILVQKDAQKTNSQQENKNLILSDRAHVDTTPQLEIFADDVKCAHGSTIGQLDTRSLFYLRSRGFSAAEARLVLTQAFAGDVIANVRNEGLRSLIEARVVAWFEAHRGEAVA